MSKEQNNIPVLDSENKFLSYTNPAKARILMDNGKVRVFSKNPFMLQLKGEPGDSKMADVKTFRSAMVNFTNYFTTEREVYVQNVSNSQIALNFSMGPGNDFPVIIPKTRKPFNLTHYVPFAAIKNSTDLRKILTRRPPALQLLEEEVYMKYYEDIATANNTSVDDEMGKAYDIMEGIMRKDKLPSETLQREMETLKEEKIEALMKPDVIHPSVIGLCAKSDPNQGTQRLAAGDFIEDLRSLAPELTREDWEFVQSKAPYKTVKSFAQKMQEDMNLVVEE